MSSFTLTSKVLTVLTRSEILVILALLVAVLKLKPVMAFGGGFFSTLEDNTVACIRLAFPVASVEFFFLWFSAYLNPVYTAYLVYCPQSTLMVLSPRPIFSLFDTTAD